MATFKTTQYQEQHGELSDGNKTGVGDIKGRIRHLYLSYTGTQAVYAIADVIKLGILPKGARVVGGRLLSPSLGTTGIFHWGYAASEELSGGVTVEVADPDAFAVSMDAGGQAADATAIVTAGFMKKFAGAVDVQLTMTEASDVGTGVIIKGYLAYVID